jgi:hypothetical protein
MYFSNNTSLQLILQNKICFPEQQIQQQIWHCQWNTVSLPRLMDGTSQKLVITNHVPQIPALMKPITLGADSVHVYSGALLLEL